MKFRILKLNKPRYTDHPYEIQRKFLGIWLGISYYDSIASAESDIRDRILKKGKYAKKGNVVIKEISSEDLVVEKLSGK